MNKDRNNLQSALALGTEPVGKLLVKFATPAIIAMVAASLYNMVDSIFIGQGVGPLAISGLAITFKIGRSLTAQINTLNDQIKQRDADLSAMREKLNAAQAALADCTIKPLRSL